MLYGLLSFQSADLASLVLRLGLAAILLYHGWPKLKLEKMRGFGQWLGSMGFPMPMFFGILVSLLEPIGGLCLAVGFATQFFALAFVIEFLVILLTVKRAAPWKENGEFDLIIFVAALSLLFLGGGVYSFDAQLFNPLRAIGLWLGI